MANFSFLNNVGPTTDDEDDTLPGSVPGAAQEVPGDYGASKAAASEYADAQARNPRPEPADATHEFQKKRAKLGDFAKNAALQGLDRLKARKQLDKEIQENSGLPGVADEYDFDYEGTKQRIGYSTPDKYGNILYQEAIKHYGGKDLDDILTPVEEAVQNYKRLTLQQQPQIAAQINQQLTAQDLPKRQAEAQRLDQEIAQAKDDLKIAATPRQAEKIKGDIQFLSSQRSQVQLTPVEKAEMTGERPVDKELTFDHIWTAGGIPREEALKAMTEMSRIVKTHGIDLDDPVSPMTFPVLYANLIKDIFNKDTSERMLRDIQGPPRKQGEQGDLDKEVDQNAKMAADTVKRGLPNVSQQIQQREARHEQVWQELAHSKNFRSVFDVIGFVLTSFLIGPRGAALFFSNMNKNGNLRHELDMLNHETAQLYRQQDSYVQMAQQARHYAVQSAYERDHLAETTRHNKAMEAQYGMHYASARNAGKMFLDPQKQRTYEQLLQGERVWKDRWNELNKMAADPQMQRANGFKDKAAHAKALQTASSMLEGARRGRLKYIEDNSADVSGEPQGARTGTSFTLPGDME